MEVSKMRQHGFTLAMLLMVLLIIFLLLLVMDRTPGDKNESEISPTPSLSGELIRETQEVVDKANTRASTLESAIDPNR